MSQGAYVDRPPAVRREELWTCQIVYPFPARVSLQERPEAGMDVD
jgi:hypothetical protein